MDDINKHLQCQECQVTFPTNEALHRHLEKFRSWSNRIRTWEEQCRAHIEPEIELDRESDELDIELCRNHPALFGARVCPVEGCKKQFSEKKQLNIHFESHDDCQCTESCVVCGTPFSHIRKFMVHTTHPEAIARHRSYIQISRIELRREARDKLHRMLIEASNREDRATKRTLEEASLGQDQSSKKIRVLNTDGGMQASNSDIGLHVETLDLFSLEQSVPRDPYAAPMFPSGDVSLDDLIADPYAARLYRYQDSYQAQVGGNNGFLPFPQQVHDAQRLHLISGSGDSTL